LPRLPLAALSRQPGRSDAEHGATGDRRRAQDQDHPEPGLLVDALQDRDFCLGVAGRHGRRRTVRETGGQLIGTSTPGLKSLVQGNTPVESYATVEQSNTSVIFGDRLIT
jgi:hypothetical protein